MNFLVLELRNAKSLLNKCSEKILHMSISTYGEIAKMRRFLRYSAECYNKIGCVWQLSN